MVLSQIVPVGSMLPMTVEMYTEMEIKVLAVSHRKYAFAHLGHRYSAKGTLKKKGKVSHISKNND